MCKVVVFAGTTEGRILAEFLEKRKIPAHICVATAYGEELLPKSGCLEISHERLNQEQMEQLMREKEQPLVLDATHPYAAQVTQNIRQACEKTGSSYVRILRGNEGSVEQEKVLYADSVEEAVALLQNTKGNILVTTGSKEAEKYTHLVDYEHRVYLRILSLPEAAMECKKLGFVGKHLICMQGPFSKELNAAMLRQWNCKYLVTKMSGSTGGFQEKLEAAWACGCIPVLIGRPLSEEGISVSACKKLLCEKFSLKPEPKITLVGIGMGDARTRTQEAQEAIEQADLLIGAKRMLDACRQKGQEVYQEYDSAKIAAYIQEHPEYENIVIVLSGDVGFYSGAKKLAQALGPVCMVCGISSVVYFMSRIGKSWEDTFLTSAHGKETNLLAEIQRHKKVFSILGTRDGVSSLAEKLLQYEKHHVRLFVGERLSYEDEKISEGCPADFVGYEADALSVVYIENEQAEAQPATHGIPDAAFCRDKVPMTKEEVRTVSLSKLRLRPDSVCYDVGAGTGSVAVEMALRAYAGKVYAIEKNPLAVNLLKQNKQKFAVDHLEIVEGLAPEAMQDLEKPDQVFIGGSSGNMKAIMQQVLEKNPSVRIVVNCIALESTAECLESMKALPVQDIEALQLNVSKAKTVGPYHMMMGENPITILCCTGKG